MDSINALVSPILGGGQTQGHMIMTKIGRILKRLAVEHNLAVIVSLLCVWSNLLLVQVVGKHPSPEVHLNFSLPHCRSTVSLPLNLSIWHSLPVTIS